MSRTPKYEVYHPKNPEYLKYWEQIKNERNNNIGMYVNTNILIDINM